MEFLLRIWGNNEIKREISLFCMRDRASDHPKSVGKLTFGLLKINSIERKISIKDEPINLTSKEFDILFFLQVILDRYLPTVRYTKLCGEKSIFVMKEILLPILVV